MLGEELIAKVEFDPDYKTFLKRVEAFECEPYKDAGYRKTYDAPYDKRYVKSIWEGRINKLATNVVVNPKYQKWEATILEEYATDTYFNKRHDGLFIAMCIFAVLFVVNTGIAIITITIGSFIYSVVILISLTVLTFQFRKYHMIRSSSKICIRAHKLGTPCSSIITELYWCTENYQKNLELIPADKRIQVEIDADLFYKHVWQVACDASSLHQMYSRGRGTLENGNSVMNTVLQKVKNDVTTLEEAVRHLNDITAITTSQAIADHYLEPTTADTFKSIALNRLQGHLELMAPIPEPQHEEVVHKVESQLEVDADPKD